MFTAQPEERKEEIAMTIVGASLGLLEMGAAGASV